MSEEQKEVIELDAELDVNDFPEDPIIELDDEGGVEPKENPELLELKSKLQELEGTNLSLKQQAGQNEALAKVLASLGDRLKEKPKPEETQEPQLDLKALIENVDKNLVLKPGETLVQTLVPMLNELEKGYEKKLSERDKELGKLKVYQDPSMKEVYETYTEEVDSIASKMKGTDAYQKAIKEVQFKHSDEIMATKLEEMKVSLMEDLKKELGMGESDNKTITSTFTNAKTNLNSGVKKVKMSRKDYDIVKKMAEQRGFFDFDSNPITQEVALDVARAEGLIQ